MYSSENGSTFFELTQEHLDNLEYSERLNRLSTDKAWVSFIVRFNNPNNSLFKKSMSVFLKKN